MTVWPREAQAGRIDGEVRLTFRYAVYFTSGLFAPENRLLRDVVAQNAWRVPTRLLCVVDDGVARHHPGLLASIGAYCRNHEDALELVAPPLVVEGGETAKQGEANVEAVRAAIDRYGICRHSYVVVIGGGAVLDLVGFAAATAHRGVRLVRVPTTVLSQNDSGVGVKNGVNAYGKKNFVGTFAPPYAVLNDSEFLETLSDRDWLCGAAEAIKVAVIKDPAFFAFLEQHADRLEQRHLPTMQRLIRRCAELHVDHINTGGDPFELGSSRPLDFGHWAGHKLEQLSGHRLRHGEAVGIGIALDSTYAQLAGLLPRSDWKRILTVLERLRLPLYAPELRLEGLLDGLSEFREHLGGELTITLPERIGRAVDVHLIEEELVRRSADVLERRAAAREEGGVEWKLTA